MRKINATLPQLEFNKVMVKSLIHVAEGLQSYLRVMTTEDKQTLDNLNACLKAMELIEDAEA